MRACFFGTYNSRHPSNRLLIRDLEAAGVKVHECHRPLWERTRDKTARFFGAPSLARHLPRYLRLAASLISEVKRAGPFDLFLAGFNGQLDVLVLRALARGRTPIVFAPLMSITETLVEDRGLFAARSVRGRLARLLDRLTLEAADVVVADTMAHKEYFAQVLGFDRRKIAVHYLGADEIFFSPAGSACGGGQVKVVLFYGQYVPLHGAHVIVEAAARMARRSDVCFHFIGTGPKRPEVEDRARALGARIAFEDWVEFCELPARIARASLCLGAFGEGRKADMVIPTKVYQAAAAGKAVVTGNAAAVREVFTGGKEIVLCRPGDPVDLARALEHLLDDPQLGRQIGEGAGRLMKRRFSSGEQAKSLVRELAAASPKLARSLG